MRPLVHLVLAGLLAMTGTAQAVSLNTLLSQMRDSAAVIALEAEREQLAIEHEVRLRERGWSVFGGADIGYLRELQAGGGVDDYGNYGASVGLRYPLLGTLNQRDQAVSDARTALIRQTYQARVRRTTQRYYLRQSFIDWWQAQALVHWCDQWRPVAREELASARERTRNQALRVSELQLLEQRWNGVLRSCERQQQLESLLRERTSRLAGVPLSDVDQPERPPLTGAPAPLAEWTDVITHHPAVTARQRVLEAASRERDHHWSDQVDSSFTIAQRLDRRMDTSGTGSGLVAGVTFEVPLAALSGSKYDSPGEARYRTARNQLTAELDQWRRYLEDNLVGYQNALDGAASAIDELQLARRLRQEREQRLAVDTESGYMAVRTARVGEAEAHLRLYRSWRTALQERAALMQVAEHASSPQALLGEAVIPWPLNDAPAANDESSVQATYVWDSHPLLDSAVGRQRHLQALAAAGFNRIYLGLDSAQVARPNALREPVSALVEAADELGIRVDLLLGDPLWLTEQHRRDLSGLIRELAALPFAGLHLDLEVEQLGWPVPPERLQQWLRTVAVATAASPWPVSLVSHHRWFSSPPDQPCVPCQLPALGVSEVSLMIYTTRSERSVELMAQARERWPGLSFRLTQSVEATLPDSQSWHGRTSAELDRLGERLADAGVSRLEWQDWRNHPAYPEAPDE